MCVYEENEWERQRMGVSGRRPSNEEQGGGKRRWARIKPVTEAGDERQVRDRSMGLIRATRRKLITHDR